MSSKIDLINKLKRLTHSNNIHEAEAAQKKLDYIIKKYNISDEELEESEIKEYSFWYHDPMQRKILVQVAYKVLGSLSGKIYSYTGRRGKKIELLVRCTYEQYLEISIQYDFYKELFQEELDVFITAFVMKHDIYPEQSESLKSINELSDEEFDRYKRASLMTQGMKNESLPHKMIESNN